MINLKELEAKAKYMNESGMVQSTIMLTLIQELRRCAEALHEIMREGTGSQGNNLESTMAYEALAELKKKVEL